MAKKIGIITFHWAIGFGGGLQCFALTTTLRKLGYDPFVVNYLPGRAKLLKILLNYFRKDSNIQSTGVPGVKQDFFEKIVNFIVKSMRGVGFKKSLEPFIAKYFKLTKRYDSPSELRRDPPKADCFICGSDQIWNPCMYFSNKEIFPYFLDFVKGTKKIAYAASSGGEALGALRAEVCKLVNAFDAISGREENILNECRTMLYQGALEQVLDPTLLLEQKDYLKILSVAKQRSNVLVTSFIQPRLYKTNCVIKNFCKIHQLQWIDLSTDYFKGPDKNEFALGSVNFLQSIKDADVVLTDSFHSSVFALIFHSRLIFIPLEGSKSNRNNRALTLFNMLDVRENVVTSAEKLREFLTTKRPLSWEAIDTKLNQQREASLDFLRRNLP